MNGSRYYVVRSEGTKYGIGFGSALAIAISYTTNKSILWAIIHGILARLAVRDLFRALPVLAATMCNLYYADLWIMPTIGSKRALALAIAALESA